MKAQLTYKKILLFNKVANDYLLEHEKKETKIVESIKNVIKQIRKNEVIEGYREMLLDNSLTHCSVDEKGNILKGVDGGYLFTPEKQKALIKANKAILDKTVEIHTRILPENNEASKELSDIQLEVFAGIVIDEVKEDN